jgi:DNA-binding response OmpR family regulator
VTVLVVGQRLTIGGGVREAVERAARDVAFAPDLAAAQDSLRQSDAPRCVLAHAEESIKELNRELRSRAKCFGVPLIAVTDMLTERVMLELKSLGADDVVAVHDIGGLTRRLAALSSFDPGARTALFQGTCLLSVPDPYHRQVAGRVLRQAGFDVSFAGDAAEALAVAERAPPKVIVVSERTPPDGGSAALAQLAKHWVGAMPAVLLTKGHDKQGEGDFSVVHEDAPPDDLLFVVNELLRPRELVESRASRRLLHAALCNFRAAGEFDARAGLTYNISREGIYVRSFDAPASKGKVWLELRPPFAREVCHLRGDVVWIRALTTGAHGAAPPGFGVRLSLEDSPPEDRIRYVRGYERLLAEGPG